METLGLASPARRARLMNLYLNLETYPEVPGVLRQLKAPGLTTAIVSNGTPHTLSTAVEGAKLTGRLDAILSVGVVGAYRPHPGVYQLAVDRLGIPARVIAFQSSNAWDAYAASAYGMRVVWCNRYRQRPERLPGKPDAVIHSLNELPALLL